MAGFVHELRVRYHETDAQHHVYNARYLEYLDVAMTEYLRDLGWPYAELVELGFDPVVGKIEIEFQRPAGFDEILRIEVRTHTPRQLQPRPRLRGPLRARPGGDGDDLLRQLRPRHPGLAADPRCGAGEVERLAAQDSSERPMISFMISVVPP